MLSVVVACLFFKIMWGWFLILLFQRREEASERYLRISLRFLAGFYAIILLSLWNIRIEEKANLILTISSLSFFAMAFYSLFNSRSIRFFSSLVAILAPFLALKAIEIESLLSFLVGSVLLGGTLVSQFLGHWYLNVVGLPLSELRRSLKVVSAFVGIKVGEFLMLSSSSIAQKLQGSWGNLNGILEALSTTSFWIVASRAVIGIITPAIFYWMTFDVLRQRNTQSATGILYATSVLVLFGESISLFIYIKLGISI